MWHQNKKILYLFILVQINDLNFIRTRINRSRPSPFHPQPSLAQARTQYKPDHMNPGHFSEICSTWFEAEAGFRIEIWTRQYRQIVQNFDPRLMELALEAPDIIGTSKKYRMFQT